MSTQTPSMSVFDEILRFNKDRDQGPLRRKLHKMAVDAFSFFRGTDHLFARSWPELRPTDVGPSIWICGDLHLENFGSYHTEDGEPVFDINDFDEALVAPCSLDLVRCATSILLAAEQWMLSPIKATGMVLAFLDQSRKAVLGEAGPRIPPGPIRDLLEGMKETPAEVLHHYTEKTKDGGRRIIRDPDKRPEISVEEAARVREAVEGYGGNPGKPEHYDQVLDVSGRLAGIGSLGLRRYLALIRGDGSPHGARLLDVKEVRRSSLLECVDGPQPPFDDEAQRVVAAQRKLQAAPAPGLGALKIDGRPFRVRQMVPDENRANLDQFQKKPHKLRKAVEVAGCVTGWSQVRGSRIANADHSAALHGWASGSALDAVAASAARFADRTLRDYQDYCKAYEAWKSHHRPTNT